MAWAVSSREVPAATGEADPPLPQQDECPGPGSEKASIGSRAARVSAFFGMGWRPFLEILRSVDRQVFLVVSFT